jgi:signal peptide peptidase SppA
MWPFSRHPVVPVLRFNGPIGLATPLRPGISIASYATPIEKAFSLSKLPTVAVVINSPGGSPVQSNLIFRRIRRLAEEKNKRVYVFCEDVAASGGYYLAIAGDEIYADPSSIIGSIGVISQSFGFVKAIDKLGIERRVYTAGSNKSTLDPFLPENPEDVARLKAIQSDVHDVFIGLVKERRLGKLKGADSELFSGAFWAGPRAVEHGLIDGISDVRSKMQQLHGENVRLKVVEPKKPGLLGRVLRGSGVTASDGFQLAFADDLVSAIETRALWSRFGL